MTITIMLSQLLVDLIEYHIYAQDTEMSTFITVRTTFNKIKLDQIYLYEYGITFIFVITCIDESTPIDRYNISKLSLL